MIWKSYVKGLFHLIFPDLCYSCRKVEPLKGGHFCLPCQHSLPFIRSKEDAVAALEGKEPFPEGIEYFRSLFYYTKESKVAEMIHRIKYQGNYRIARYLGSLLGERIKEDKSWSNYVLVPVPIHKKRRRERGFNQSEEIAKGIQSVLGTNIKMNYLIRTKYEQSQISKDKQSRALTLRNSFKVVSKPGEVKKKIILVDDVVTTGSTLAACIHALEVSSDQVAIVSLGVGI